MAKLIYDNFKTMSDVELKFDGSYSVEKFKNFASHLKNQISEDVYQVWVFSDIASCLVATGDLNFNVDHLPENDCKDFFCGIAFGKEFYIISEV